MKRKCTFFLVFAVAVSSSVLGANIAVTTTEDAGTLLDSFAGLGFMGLVTNSTYTGSLVLGSAGKFTGGSAAGLGWDEGAVLTTGLAANAVGPNSSPATSSLMFGSGDLLGLNTIPGHSTTDISILEIEFISGIGGNVSFNYLFGTEEQTAPGRLPHQNDVFGVFLNGDLLASADTFDATIDNPIGAMGVEYDGLTAKTPVSFDILPNMAYTLKLAIGDEFDAFWDSGVFLGNLEFAPIPEHGTLLLFGSGLAGVVSIYRKRRKS